MGTSTEHVMTLANSIIGVSVLAMPFCFKQCGIVLSILLLLLSGVMTRLACHYLLKSAINARRRNFEILAFHTFGPTGKLAVELSIIGFMLGTCTAFFVVMGDLGPSILGPVLNIEAISTLRPSVLMGLGLLVVLPLGLLKNVDSLSSICAASIAFYLCLVLKVMAEATTHLLSWDWIDKVNLWRPAGIPQCIPIFSMALSCQTQLFEVFDSVPNTPLEKMNAIIRSAVNICTGVYISVGFFGYIAYCTQNFSGNLLLSFSPTIMSDIFKLGFVLSVAVSFPLVIFPCRASLHSLLFRRGHTPHHELLSGGGNFIPEPRFKCLTICIVMVSLGTGLLIPNIEVVLGLVGSTIGIIICIIIPALTYVCLSNKKNNERLLAQILVAFGMVIMVLGTYSNLYATEEAITKQTPNVPVVPPQVNQPGLVQLPEHSPELIKEKLDGKLIDDLSALKELKTLPAEDTKKEIVAETIPVADSNKRKEPPVPVAPGDKIAKENSVPVQLPSVVPSDVKEKKPEELNEKVIEKPNESIAENKKEETVGEDAIKRGESLEQKNADLQKKNEELMEKLSKHEQAEKKILEEQKAVLEEIRKQQKQNNEAAMKIKPADIPYKKINDNEKTLDHQLGINSEGSKVIESLKNNQRSREQKLEKPMNEIKYDTSKKGEKSLKIPVENNKLPILAEIPVENRQNNNKPPVQAKPLVENSINNNRLPILDKVVQNNNVPVVKGINLSPDLTQNILKGVPFPLAVKNNNIVNEIKPEDHFKELEVSKKDVIKPQEEKKGMVRDILSEKEKPKREEREKRDVEVVEKIDLTGDDSVKMSVEKDEMKNSDIVHTGNDADINKLSADNDAGKVIGDNLATDEQSKTVEKVIKENKEGGKSLTKIINDKAQKDKEKCSKEKKEETVLLNVENKNEVDVKPQSDNDAPEVKSKNSEKQNVEDTESLIKTPSYLSNPELILNPSNINPNAVIRNGIQGVKPMSRDLKSVNNPDEDQSSRRQERASEVT